MRPTNRSLLDALAREIVGRSVRDGVQMTGSSVGGGGSEETQDEAWTNPMTTRGDLIAGGESGGPIRVAIGTEDFVLTVVETSPGVLEPRWAAAAAGYTDEQVRDVIGAALVAGSNIDIDVDDALNTITISDTNLVTQYTDEMARDAIGAALVAGTGITITVSDVGDTITIEATAGGGQYRSYTYATYGGGYFLFDSDGHAVYTLEDLE